MSNIDEKIPNILCEDGKYRVVYRTATRYWISFYNGKRNFAITGVVVDSRFIAQGKNRTRLKMPLVNQKKEIKPIKKREEKRQNKLRELSDMCQSILADYPLFIILDCLSIYAIDNAKKAQKLENKQQKQAWTKSAKLLSELSNITAIIETSQIIKDCRKEEKQNDQK